MPSTSLIDRDSRLLALSPLDGRYAPKLDPLRVLLTEAGFMKHRVQVEVAWLIALSDLGMEELPKFSEEARGLLASWVTDFSTGDAARIKEIESQINHDVKAVEYFLKEKSQSAGLGELVGACEFVHFACTSEDINNVSHALMLRTARSSIIVPVMQLLIDRLALLIDATKDQAMLSRTHGQPASPTTMGKELANFRARLRRARDGFSAVTPLAKMNGAVGNFNAHKVAVPEVDWCAFTKRVVEELGLEANPMTIQIEPHDWIAEYCDALARFNTVLLDFCRDIWGYVALGYFKQRLNDGEVGSSTMPHKVNPIDFENAEGNLGIANAILRHFSEKLPVSRWQRDLSDSTVLRNLGVGLGHSLLALDSCLLGLSKLAINPQRMDQDLAQSWEVLAEPIQTTMRRFGLPEPYEQLKGLTRGREVTPDSIKAFVVGLAIPDQAKEYLLRLTPFTYLGEARALAMQELRLS